MTENKINNSGRPLVGRSERWIATSTHAVALAVTGLFVVGMLIFPVQVALERDLQINGLRTTGTINGYKKTLTKSKQVIHHCRVTYHAGEKILEEWVFCRHKPRDGENFEIVYAPIFPAYSASAEMERDAWDQNLAGRSLGVLIIGTACALMIALIIRKMKKLSAKVKNSESNGFGA